MTVLMNRSSRYPGGAQRNGCVLTVPKATHGPRFRVLAFAFAVMVAQPAWAWQPGAGFSIAETLSAPLAFDLTAAPAAGRFAWRVDEEGARNLWVAEPGAGGLRGRPLTHYAGDDGFMLGDITWTPSADAVVFARGSMLEDGHAANFFAAPGGMPAREVWIVPVAGGPPRRIGAGHAPRVSPRGDVVAFLDDGKIMLAALSGEPAPRVLLQDRGEDGDLAWSPDGSRLAFVSDRGQHNLVGVYDFTKQTVTWIAPSFDEDQAPAWSPDGGRLAFIRIPHHVESSLSHPTGQPWSIWVARADGGGVHAAFTADPGPGSVFSGLDTGRRDLFWAAGDRIVFPWEKTGWINLYAVSTAGGAPQSVASGPFEVFSAVLSADRTAVIFSANRADLDARRLWRVALDGGAITPLTGGEAFQDQPAVSSDGRTVAFMEGDWRRPFHPQALADGREAEIATAPTPSRFPGAAFAEPRVVSFPAADGLIVHGQLFEPPAGTRAPGPAILFFHGGPRRQILPGWDEIRFYAECYAMNQHLASEGYTVLSVNYRGGSGYGLAFREPPDFGPGGASEARDIEAAALWLGRQGGVDAKRIGIYGASYGGLMTADGLALYSNLLAAGVDYAGVHHWRADNPALSKVETGSDAVETAWKSSALAHVDTWTSPVLVAHSDDDRDVKFEQSGELVEALRARGTPVEELVIPDEVHDLRLHRSWLTWLGATDAFFARRLGGPNGP